MKTNNILALTISKNQRTRIGTPAPFLTLGSERVEIADSNGSKSDLVFVTGGGGPNVKGYPQVVFDKSRNTNLAPTAVQNGDWTGVVVGRGYDGANYVNNSAIIFGVDSIVSSGYVPGNIQFQTSAGSNSEKMRISNNGNIGIGTNNPWLRLHVEANAPGVPATYVRNQNAAGYSGTIFGSMAGNMAHIGYGKLSSPGWSNQAYAGSIANIPFVLTTNDQERVRIDAIGNVGISNNNPQYPLSFSSTVGDKISLWGGAGNHYGLGIQGNLFQIHSANFVDDIAFGYGSSAAFTENMRIKGNGNVGIGTITPTSKLEVNGSMKITDGTQGAGKILVSDATGLASWQAPSGSSVNAWGLTGNVGTIPATNFMGTTDNQDVVFKSNNSEVMRIKQNNKINVSSNNTPPLYPYAKLSIADENGLNSDVEIHVAQGSWGQLVLDQSGGTLAAPTASANGQWSGVVVGRSYDGNGIANTGAVIFGVDSAVSPGNMRGNIQFQTSGGSQTEKMRITRNGDVGIGTTTPWLRLHVEANAPGVPVTYVRNQNAAGYSGTIFGSMAGNMAHIGYGNPSSGWANLAYAGSIGNIPFVLTTNDQERVRIDATGNVGISNNNPPYPLSFSSTVGDKISLWGAAGNHYGLGIQSNLFQIHSANPVDDIAFGYGSSAAFTENMRIKGNCDVGIGTTTPWVRLQVENNAAGIPTTVFRNQNASGYSGTIFTSSAGANMGHFGYANPTAPGWANQVYAGSIGGVPFVLTTNDTERMRIDASGNVGIGTTTPSTQLEVNGYTKLGSNAPAIKTIEFSGTTAASQGDSVNVAHGLNSARILSLDVLVEYTAGSFIHHSYTYNSGYDFSFFITPANIVVGNSSSNSNQILSKPFKMLVTYKQ